MRLNTGIPSVNELAGPKADNQERTAMLQNSKSQLGESAHTVSYCFVELLPTKGRA